ncbi:MAG: ribonuclease R [Bacteroidales bacterium]|jgi:ribonuclease R|nr:ribonuclease R [Bacteroidales bacterium]
MKKKKKHSPAQQQDLTAKILHIFRSSPRKPYNVKQISSRLHITDEEGKNKINHTLNILSQKEEIEEVNVGKYRLKSQSGYIVGKVDSTPYGTAYIISPETEEDIFIAPPNLHHALHGDTVKVYLFAQTSRRRPEGEIIEILEKGRREFVGIVEKNNKYAFVIVDNKKAPYDIFVSHDDLGGAQDGQKVVVKITEWPKKAKNPIGTITTVLGNVGDNETEMHAILAEFQLPYKFAQEIEDAAKYIPEEISKSEIQSRKDFRNITTFTIDPHDAKDFDDALSIQFLENNTYEIGVHIADVTHYITEDSKLEKEAQARATSVYLVDRVVPMLPEKLSNKVCSLRPNEDKLTFSAVFTINEDAEILSEWFGRTIINSDKRFSYEDAQQVIENKEGDLAQELEIMNTLAKKLRAKRFSNGAIAFDRKEVKFNIDKDGKPISIYYKESKDANKLIEEFMLLANRKVAEFISKKKGNPTFVYRIHDKPDEFKLMDFSNFIKKFGYKINTSGDSATSKSINKLLDDIKNKKEQNVFETLAVRSMAKASYSTENIGHYGLAFAHYTHFTSPIRRYPDMMVHRLLNRYLHEQKSADVTFFEELCKHSSSRELLASNAERASIKYKQVEWMKDHLGEVFEGVVSGVTEWGMFVEIKENLCEGMVSIRDLDDDQYIFDDKNYCLRGKFHNHIYTLGDTVTIKIVRADLIKRQLDFILADADSEE